MDDGRDHRVRLRPARSERDSECPADFACSKPAASPVTKCFPAEGGGGCAIAPTGRAGALPLALLVGLATLVLARRRSRRR
jgi:hypothetical protein